MKAFGWSIREMDESNAENVLLFVYRLTSAKGASKKKKVFADQAGWL